MFDHVNVAPEGRIITKAFISSVCTHKISRVVTVMVRLHPNTDDSLCHLKEMSSHIAD
jgi:hypothetical protein